ncbi:MAG: hypothetical protein CVU20_03810 [Betaproteobacteria bacterium HGW-Betaproteobacteria-14]|nr:MAG: hypothetical protein CVU20_03810 [Betaproteobacteria bacterium HGW-Betaproteobacteria-14]
MKRITSIAVLLGLTFVAGGVLAHDDAYLDTQKAPNGGQLRMAGPYHYELVVVKDAKEAKENAIVVYVTDHAGQKVLTEGASGTATILAGKLKATSTLKPDGDNRMKGLAKYASTPDMKVVVSITLSGKPAEQARFTPIKTNLAANSEHKH